MGLWLLQSDPAGNCCGCEQRVNPCDPCGFVTGSCCYTIGNAFTPDFTTPTIWGSLALAQAELANRTYDCLVCGSEGGVTYPQGSLTASDANSVLHIAGNITSNLQPSSRVDTFRFHAEVGTISIPFTLTCATPASIALDVEATLWVDGGTSSIDLDRQTSSSGLTSFSGTLHLHVTVTGQYIIRLVYQVTGPNYPFTGTFDVSSNAGISFCTIRAAYLDVDSNIKFAFPVGCSECIDVCYLTLPSLMDSGSYTSQAQAQSAIDTLTDGCVVEGEDLDGNPLSSLSAIINSSSLDITAEVAAVTTGLILFAATVTALGGIEVDYDLVCTNAVGSVFSLYDTTFVEIDRQISHALTGSISFIIPSDGQYFVRVEIESEFPGAAVSVDLTATSDDVMDICVIRAAYDDGSGMKYVYCT